MSIATPPARCNRDHAKHKDDPCRNIVDDPRTGLSVHSAWSSAKQLKKPGEIMPMQGKKEDRGV